MPQVLGGLASVCGVVLSATVLALASRPALFTPGTLHTALFTPHSSHPALFTPGTSCRGVSSSSLPHSLTHPSTHSLLHARRWHTSAHNYSYDNDNNSRQTRLYIRSSPRSDRSPRSAYSSSDSRMYSRGCSSAQASVSQSVLRSSYSGA